MLAVAMMLISCGGSDDNDAPPRTFDPFEVKSVSSRPDLVTGGDVLLDVVVPDGVALDRARVQLNGVDVTPKFKPSESDPRTLRGLVDGLQVDPASPAGKVNTIVAANADEPRQTGELALTSFPSAGPMISGPRKAPWECRTQESGLGAPLDADCSATIRFSYYYRTTNNQFRPLADPAGARPGDLGTTTTNDGKVVPYIVRVESGTNNRSIYRIAALDDPDGASAAAQQWRGAGSWNRKLIMSFGGGCGNQYNQGKNAESDALNAAALGAGFAVATSTAMVNQQHCNPHLQGETALMLKEYFSERYGIPKWTAGTGGSGGAIQQYLLAQLFPGLLDGIQPSIGFPDSMAEDVMACALFKKNVYAANPAVWTAAKQTAVEGYSAGTCTSWHDVFNFTGNIDAIRGAVSPFLANVGGDVSCGLVDQSLKYDPVTNPSGVRCDFYEANVNALGRNAAGHARRPFDNVGVQYGLAALNSAAITVSEFLELNERAGGFDGDGQVVATRSVGDPVGIQRAYEAGVKNSFGGGLATTAIITIRSNGSTVGDIHHRFTDFMVRERLRKANGRVDNQIILTASSGNANAAGVNLSNVALDMMNRWLDALAAAPGPLTADKVVAAKPADVADTCWVAGGTKLVGEARLGPNACNTAYPVYGTPTTVAGASAGSDAFKCTLVPVNAANYAVTFTPAEFQRLQAIFADGVCDWNQSDPNLRPLKGTYQRLSLE